MLLRQGGEAGDCVTTAWGLGNLYRQQKNILDPSGLRTAIENIKCVDCFHRADLRARFLLGWPGSKTWHLNPRLVSWHFPLLRERKTSLHSAHASKTNQKHRRVQSLAVVHDMLLRLGRICEPLGQQDGTI